MILLLVGEAGLAASSSRAVLENLYEQQKQLNATLERQVQGMEAELANVASKRTNGAARAAMWPSRRAAKDTTPYGNQKVETH